MKIDPETEISKIIDVLFMNIEREIKGLKRITLCDILV